MLSVFKLFHPLKINFPELDNSFLKFLKIVDISYILYKNYIHADYE